MQAYGTDQIAALENRIAQLEAQFAEVTKLKGLPGPRGPAGDISAAIANAESAGAKVAAKAIESTKTAIQKRDEESAAKIAVIETRLKTYFENLEHHVAVHVIKILEEYGVVSSHDGRPIKYS